MATASSEQRVDDNAIYFFYWPIEKCGCCKLPSLRRATNNSSLFCLTYTTIEDPLNRDQDLQPGKGKMVIGGANFGERFGMLGI